MDSVTEDDIAPACIATIQITKSFKEQIAISDSKALPQPKRQLKRRNAYMPSYDMSEVLQTNVLLKTILQKKQKLTQG